MPCSPAVKLLFIPAPPPSKYLLLLILCSLQLTSLSLESTCWPRLHPLALLLEDSQSSGMEFCPPTSNISTLSSSRPFPTPTTQGSTYFTTRILTLLQRAKAAPSRPPYSSVEQFGYQILSLLINDPDPCRGLLPDFLSILRSEICSFPQTLVELNTTSSHPSWNRSAIIPATAVKETKLETRRAVFGVPPRFTTTTTSAPRIPVPPLPHVNSTGIDLVVPNPNRPFVSPTPFSPSTTSSTTTSTRRPVYRRPPANARLYPDHVKDKIVRHYDELKKTRRQAGSHHGRHKRKHKKIRTGSKSPCPSRCSSHMSAIPDSCFDQWCVTTCDVVTNSSVAAFHLNTPESFASPDFICPDRCTLGKPSSCLPLWCSEVC